MNLRDLMISQFQYRNTNYSIFCYIYCVNVIKYTIILVILRYIDKTFSWYETQSNKSSARRKRQISTMARRTNWQSFSTVNAYCCNRQQPSLEVLDKVAECLKVDMKELIIERSERESLNLE